MLHEYNYRGFNPYYQANPISKWLEELLREGDLISDDRLGDLILREIDKSLAEYVPMASLYTKFEKSLKFKGTTTSTVSVKAEATQEIQQAPDQGQNTQSDNEKERESRETYAEAPPPKEEERIDLEN